MESCKKVDGAKEKKENNKNKKNKKQQIGIKEELIRKQKRKKKNSK